MVVTTQNGHSINICHDDDNDDDDDDYGIFLDEYDKFW